MKVTVQVSTAKGINEEHRLARTCAETAVEHAIQCGRMLVKLKGSIPHGEFEKFVAERLDFATSTARKYMKAAGQNATGVAFSTLQSLFPSGTKQKATPGQPPQMVPAPEAESAPDEPDDGEPVPVPSAATPPQESATSKAPAEEFDPDAHWQPEEDEARNLELLQKEYDATIEKVMGADDKLLTAHAEIKRLTALVAVITQSRDGYQNRSTEVIRRYKALQRENDRLKREIDDLQKRVAEAEEAVF